MMLVVCLGLAGQSDGRQMKLVELRHTSRKLGANEWWDAVTGADEYGDLVTTFMHKRWGMAFQLYHDSRHTYLPFRFIPNLSYVSGGEQRPEAIMMFGPGELESVDYWFASRHLDELNQAREVDSVLPSQMEMGGWRGNKYGDNMMFEHGAVMLSQHDDSFTTPRQLVLTSDGFIYMGLAGIAVSVLYDETGKMKYLPNIRAEPQHGGACVLYQNFEIREKVLPQLLSLKASVINKYWQSFTETLKLEAVRQRANNPLARSIMPDNWSKRKDGWTWVGKGSGNMQDGCLPYGE